MRANGFRGALLTALFSALSSKPVSAADVGPHVVYMLPLPFPDGFLVPLGLHAYCAKSVAARLLEVAGRWDVAWGRIHNWQRRTFAQSRYEGNCYRQMWWVLAREPSCLS